MVKAGPIPNALAGFQEPTPYTGLLRLASTQWGGGAQSSLNLICHALLTSLGGLLLSEQKQRKGEWGWVKVKREGKLQLGCKINE